MNLEMEDQPIFKILVVGHSGVGKTSLIYQYIKGIFKLDYNVTVGVEFYTKSINQDNSSIQLQIWDTVNQL